MLIGVDIVENERILLAVKRSGDSFVQRVLNQAERSYVGHIEENIARFAGIWAAKESAVKALGTGFRHGITFHDINIDHDEWGMPFYRFSGVFLTFIQERKLIHSTLSISHCRSHAIAATLLSQ